MFAKLVRKPFEFVAIARRLSVPLRMMATIVAFNLFSLLLEGIGIGMLLPIFEVLQKGQGLDISTLTGWYWDVLRAFTGFIGVPLALGTLLAISFTFLVIRQAFAYFSSWYQRTAARGASDQVRRRVFRAILKSRTGRQDKIKSGEIVGDLTVELSRAHSAIFTAVRCVGLLAQISLYVAGLIALSPLVTGLCLGLIALIALSFRRLFVQVGKAGAAITEANAELSGFIAERVRNLRLVRLSGMEETEAASFAQLSKRHAEEHVRQKMVTSRLTLLPEPIAIGFAYVVVFVGFTYFSMGLDRLGLFVIVLVRLMPVLRGLISDYNNVVGQWASVVRLDRHLRTFKEEREDTGGKLEFTRLDSDVRYDNVSLRYRKGERPALENVTVRIPAHRMTALVGPSGAGKSSFVDLLPRLRDPTEGQILFDGLPIQDFSTKSVRTGIAFVPQQAQIMEGTVAEHIRYGKVESTDEEIREAARIAGALHFIEGLPHGFDTELRDGARRLSGGQRQRLDIARALNRGAPILILDEPTSALDALSEGAFREVLRDLREKTNRTIIVIAHRMSTIADADLIVVFSQGRVEAVGTHEDLLQRGGWYASACGHQTLPGGHAQPALT
jgi:ABC-type multidrug transport system fused ATPase/permease subunit